MKAVIAIDLGRTTTLILDKVREVFGLDDELCLVHVAEPNPDMVGWDVGPQTVRDATADRFRQEHRLLQNVAEDFRSDGYSCTALLVQGGFADKILDVAEDIDAGMIVLGSHGKGIARQLTIGSVSADVLGRTKRPVLIVPVGK